MSHGPPTWRLDEQAHAGHEHLDPEYVAGYERKSATDWSEDITALQALGVGATSTVIDFGAGRRSRACSLPHVARVVAIDPSEAMVAAMRERSVEVVCAGFLSYEHDGDLADAVYTRNALHHLPDFWKALALERIARLLRRGGVLLLRDIVYSFEPAEAATVIGAWLASARTDPAKGWSAAELAKHLREEHSTFSWLLEPLLERAGLRIEDRRLSPSRVYAAYTCIRR